MNQIKETENTYKKQRVLVALINQSKKKEKEKKTKNNRKEKRWENADGVQYYWNTVIWVKRKRMSLVNEGDGKGKPANGTK